MDKEGAGGCDVTVHWVFACRFDVVHWHQCLLLNASESICELPSGGDDGCNCGDRHGMMLVAKHVGESLGTCVHHDEAYAAIILEGRSNVPPLDVWKLHDFL